MVVLISINTYRTSLRQRQQNQLIKQQDVRIKMMNEILSGIRVIKLMGWEAPFRSIIDRMRAVEIDHVKKIDVHTCVTSLLWAATPFLVSIASLGMYALM